MTRIHDKKEEIRVYLGVPDEPTSNSQHQQQQQPQPLTIESTTTASDSSLLPSSLSNDNNNKSFYLTTDTSADNNNNNTTPEGTSLSETYLNKSHEQIVLNSSSDDRTKNEIATIDSFDMPTKLGSKIDHFGHEEEEAATAASLVSMQLDSLNYAPQGRI